MHVNSIGYQCPDEVHVDIGDVKTKDWAAQDAPMQLLKLSYSINLKNERLDRESQLEELEEIQWPGPSTNVVACGQRFYRVCRQGSNQYAYVLINEKDYRFAHLGDERRTGSIEEEFASMRMITPSKDWCENCADY